MNYSRIALTVVAATIADFAYGFVVFGNLLTASFASQAGIYRTAEAQMAYMPAGAAGLVVAMIAAVILYARACRSGGLSEGLGFGTLLALFAIGANVIVDYATINMSADHTVKMAAATLGEWLVVGAVIGLVHKPSR